MRSLYILAFPAALSRNLFVVTSSVKGEIYVKTIETCTINCSQIESFFLFSISFIAHAGRYTNKWSHILIVFSCQTVLMTNGTMPATTAALVFSAIFVSD